MGKWFGTNGIRGIIGESMTPDLALQVGKAVGTWLSVGDRVCTGTDARQSRDMLVAAFAAGLHSTGVHTVELGILPSPAIQLYVRDQGFAAGGIITASHNPPPFNGIKLVAPDGTETSSEEESVVESYLISGEFRSVAWDEVGTHSVDDHAAQHYVDAVLAQVDADAIRQAGLKVVLDPGGGAGCVTTPAFLESLGVEVIGLSCALDGQFLDRPSEPTPQNSAACMEAVVAHDADLGVLQDGDADRAVFIDDKGAYVWGDQTLALAALYELPRHPAGIMCTAVSSSSCVQDAVDMAGGTLHWGIVGSPVVARNMIAKGAVFGGEDNGGLMFARHQMCRDGLMAIGFMLELIATTGKPFHELVQKIPRYALVKDKIAVPDDAKHATMAQVSHALQEQADLQDVDTQDGVKAFFPTGWVLVRPSGTEAIIRIQAEAKTEADARALVARCKALLT